MIKLYHSSGTRGFRVIWLCEELGVDYDVQKVDFSKEYRLSSEWLQINPLGKVPSLEDGELLMSESCAMMQYILDRYGNGLLQPLAGTIEHANFLQWLWFSEATFSRPVGEIVNHRREFPGELGITDVVKEMQSRIFKCILVLDKALEEKPFILGKEFSAADISLGYTLLIAQDRIEESLPQRVLDYWDSISSRKAFKIAKEA
ncbi:glutathione S-transferase family protein [Alphaproteobacteria bacterium]|jgi:glutathione S-transferase|nr:glutathione S-transferase family protein [Alphaproteobacteria bacterium]